MKKKTLTLITYNWWGYISDITPFSPLNQVPYLNHPLHYYYPLFQTLHWSFWLPPLRKLSILSLTVPSKPPGYLTYLSQAMAYFLLLLLFLLLFLLLLILPTLTRPASLISISPPIDPASPRCCLSSYRRFFKASHLLHRASAGRFLTPYHHFFWHLLPPRCFFKRFLSSSNGTS